MQAASHEADAARKSIEEIEGKFEAVRKMRKEHAICLVILPETLSLRIVSI